MPQRLLTDNGLALNPSRRGYLGQLVEHVSRIGVDPITGKPYKPTTQDKNERFHQTLFRYLDKQPLADSLAELQTQVDAQVDAFDHIYNTERPHQGLPGRLTPATAWKATPKADPPRPRPIPESFDRPRPNRNPKPRHQPPPDLPADTHVRKLSTAGTFMLDRVVYMIDTRRAFEQVLVVNDGDKIIVTDLDGEILVEHIRPEPGITYLGNGRPRGPRPKDPKVSPKS